VRRLLCLLIFTEVGYEYVRPLAREGDRYGAADTRVRSRDQSNAAIEPSTAPIGVFAVIRGWSHLAGRPRTLLLLGGKRRPELNGICGHLITDSGLEDAPYSNI
jgi:hypothetical protein